MADSNAYPQSVLAEFLMERIGIYRANRAVTEAKWRMNDDLFHRVFNQEWKFEEGQDWRSKITSGLGKSKVATLVAILADTVLQGGSIPYMLKVDKAFSAQGDLYDDSLSQSTDVLNDINERTKADFEFIRCCISLAKYGECWQKNKVMSVPAIEYRTVDDGTGAIGTAVEKIKLRRDMPATEMVSVYNMFWDMECSGGVEDMDMVIQYSTGSAYELRRMKGQPGFMDDEIDAVLEEISGRMGFGSGQNAAESEPRLQDLAQRTRQIDFNECWGRVPRSRIDAFIRERQAKFGESAGLVVDLNRNDDNSGDDVECVTLLANGHPVRFLPTEVEDRPHSRAKAEDDIDRPHGIGVIDDVEVTARNHTGALRLYLDNKRLSANAVFVEKREWLMDEADKIYPGMRLNVSPECDDVRKAFAAIQFPDVGASLLDAIQVILQMADDDTLVSRQEQGLAAIEGGGITAFESRQRMEMSSKHTGQIIRSLDMGIIEPGMRFKLDYIQVSPEYADIAGPFVVQALGFSSFMNRQVRLQKLLQRLELTLKDPDLKMMTKLRDLMREIDKMMDFDPDQFTLTEEELAQQQMAAQQAALAAQMGGPEPQGPIPVTQSAPGEDMNPQMGEGQPQVLPMEQAAMG